MSQPLPDDGLRNILDRLVTDCHNSTAKGDTTDFVLRYIDAAEDKIRYFITDTVEHVINSGLPDDREYSYQLNQLRAEQRQRFSELLKAGDAS